MLKSRWFLLVLAVLTFPLASVAERKTLKFQSKDGLPITADLYLPEEAEPQPVLVLFHQAGSSRGEYLEIAARLSKRGFPCLAVDLRAGRDANGVANETAQQALAQGLKVTYVDALPDVEAALEFARAKFVQQKIVAWGSSYSASLVLEVAGRRPELVDGVVAFSPGEYFGDLGKPKDWIRTAAGGIKSPVFITSAQREQEMWSPIFRAILVQNKAAFLPASAGEHGSRALWKESPGSEEYWSAVLKFLGTTFQAY